MKNGYAVVWTGNGPGTAEVQSYHRTQAAAEKRAALILRRIRRVPGQEHCGSFSRPARIVDGRIELLAKGEAQW